MTPTPPSLARRALMALVLMIGFYALAAVIIVALLWLPYAEARYLHHLNGRLVLFALVGAGGIIAGIVPRIDRFPDPGPRLTPEQQPRLFAVLAPLARATGQPVPMRVFLVQEMNAWVAERGGVLGIGSHRVMGIGLPLLELLTVAELRAVLAHEFGHFHGGDTSLGPWLYKTRAGIGRTIRSLPDQHSWIRAPFLWYGNLFLRVTHAASRQQEYAADALAAKVAGSDALASGLKKLHAFGPLVHFFWDQEIAPPLMHGLLPPVGAGIARLVGSPRTIDEAQRLLARALTESASDPYDTHPALKDRLDALPTSAAVEETTARAVTLLDDPDHLDRVLLESVLTADAVRSLRPVSWEEMATAFWIPIWEAMVRGSQAQLAGLTPAGCAAFAGHPAAPAVRWQLVSDEAHAPEAHVDVGVARLGATLSVLLHHRGWRIHMLPGEELVFSSDGREIRPYNLLSGLLLERLPAAAWEEQWRAIGLADEDLGALAASLPVPARDSAVAG